MSTYGARSRWHKGTMAKYEIECFMAMKNADKTNYEQGFKEAFEIGHDVNVKHIKSGLEKLKDGDPYQLLLLMLIPLLLDNSEYQQRILAEI